MAHIELRPSVGFCLQTTSTGNPPARWYLNMCKHKMCEMPVGYSGKPVSRDYILAHGIGNMQVPFDMGSFRKLKERADGAKQTTYCIDVVFNPLIIQLFMEDDFSKKLEQFRPFVVNLALKRIEESVGVKLAASEVKLVKTFLYKDGEGADGTVPREFTELPGNMDCFDEDVPRPPNQAREPEPLISDITPGPKKPIIKRGFLNKKEAAPLYGPEGSSEGVLPENAGDPMGWMPKKLRNTCKIVDCNSPEYQENERRRQAVNETNAANQSFKDELTKDMAKWAKRTQPDKWGEDRPEGTDPPPAASKYDVDYSRFNSLDDLDEPAAAAEERDWYYDSAGQRREKPRAADAATASAPSQPAGGSGTAMKRGFLESAKSPLYPKGSEQRAPLSEEELMKEMRDLMVQHGGEALGIEAPPSGEERKPSVAVRGAAAELRQPAFELQEEAAGEEGVLRLAVAVPGLESMEDVRLDVTERGVSLAFPLRARLKPLQVELPKAVIPTRAKAKFSKKSQQISITLPTAAKGC